ncbi:hypothetical protein M9H77_01240 [Catharanthus roseus]|uniref:Uncharacterized protein n=1 Tax=Catharanthus roseus TaxID=4058 RepID=A0ACC0C5F1_CATRO|nr:hypothetical protein M9H77_01240 [Catharanthus roseus]
MGPKTCKVCDNAQSKYKCPSCLIPYCSLPCYKKHKEVPCVKPEPASREQLQVPCVKPESSSKEQLPVAAPPAEQEKVFYFDEPSEVLQHYQLESVASTSEIREALKDEGLKKLIYNIDSSADAETELNKAMEVEAFRLFSEKIISAISSDVSKT